MRRGKTAPLDPAGARRLNDAIDAGSVRGLCDRALIGVMVYSFRDDRDLASAKTVCL
jgi:hypothetical protein